MIRVESTRSDTSVSHFAEMGRRFLVIVAIAFWLGGFTFYAGVVIHTGHRVFGGSRETGFLTQQVTRWLNLSGAFALAILLWNAFASGKARAGWVKRGLWVTWALMAAVEAALFALHPVLDQMLDVNGHRILAGARFERWHLLYLNLSTFQWAAGVLHTLLALIAWRSLDRARNS